MPAFVERGEAHDLIRAGAQVVEVLEKSQFREVHLPGAVSIPLWELDERAQRELDRERPVLVYCYDYQ